MEETRRSDLAEARSADDVRRALAEQDYLADQGLATAVFLALRMGRPLFCEGDAGVGKTSVAAAIAVALYAPLIRLK